MRQFDAAAGSAQSWKPNPTWGDSSVMAIVGGRGLSNIKNQLDWPKVGNVVDVKERLSKHANRLWNGDIDSRVEGSIRLLVELDDSARLRHSEAIESWQNTGEGGPSPRMEPSRRLHFERLFSEIFPRLKVFVRLAGSHIHVSCSKDGGPEFSPVHLSQGEKQLFCLLADVLVLGRENRVFLVDEPEMNLHPPLACKFWDVVETSFPESRFVYATHSLDFAFRPSTERIIVLGGNPTRAREIDRVTDLLQEERIELVGALPGILNASVAIAVEGTESSFDHQFYSWVLGDDQIAVVPVGASNDVKRAVGSDALWARVAPDARICGVIDRDYSCHESGENCVVLDLHEAESYLCHPEIVSDLSGKLGLTETPVTREHVVAQLVAVAKENRMSIAAKRAASLATGHLSPSINRRDLAGLASEAEFRAALQRSACSAFDTAKRLVEGLDAAFTTELRALEAAIEHNDLATLLSLLPGKELMPRMAKLLRLPVESFPIAVRKHLSVGDYAHLAALRDGILGRLARSQST